MSEPAMLIQIQSLPAIDNISEINQNDEKRFYTAAIRRLVRKLDWRLLPFIILLQISSSINLVTIGMCFCFESFVINNGLLGHAKLMAIQTDLNMTDLEYNLAISVFYIAKVRKCRC